MSRDRIDAKLLAKDAIKGHVFLLFLYCLLASLPMTIVSIAYEVFGIVVRNNQAGWISAVYAILSLLSIVAYLACIPLMAGLNAKYLHMVRGGQERDVSIFVYYAKKDWVEKLKAYLLASLFIFLGFICLIVPGIILSLKYSVLGYVFADNPGISYRDAMDKCKEVTKGKKGGIFVFELSFIGWFLLVGITFGIAAIYVAPYYSAAFAAFYDKFAEKPQLVVSSPTDSSSNNDLFF